MTGRTKKGSGVSARGRIGARRYLRRFTVRWIVGRGLLVVAGALLGFFVWAGVAAGTQPFETYESAVASDGPVAQFRFSDPAGSSSIGDSVGSYTAVNSGIVLGGEGPFGGSGSGSFGGEASAVLPVDPLAGAGAFTAEAWVDWAGGAYKQPVFDFGSSSSNYMYLTPASGLSGHKLLFEIHTSSGTASVAASKLGTKGWEYVAVSETSAGTLTLYVDGEQVGQTTGVTLSPASLGSSPPDDYLGRSVIAGEPGFDGSLSNVAFYDTALSASRILAHYRAGKFPVNTGLPVISGHDTQGKALTAKAGSWSGLEPVTFAYQWLRCNSAGEACANIEGAESTSYTLGNADVGRTLRVAVSASSSAGAGSATSAPTAPIAGIKPANTTLPVVSGSAVAGGLLTASAGVWEGSTPFSYAYVWEACGSRGQGCKAISGANGASYRVLGSQIGMKLQVLVTASNAAGSKSASSTETAEVGPGAPANTVLPRVFGPTEVGQSLNASAGAWAGSEPFSYSYQWQSCDSAGEDCSNIAGATGASYTPTAGELGGALRVIVTAKNSVGQEAAVSPPTPSVTGRPPANTQLPGISGAAKEGETLTVSPGSWEGAEPISYSYQWQRCAVQPLGSEGSGDGEFEQPGDVAVDASGDLWVADTGNDRIEEFNEHGEYLDQFGSPGSAPGQLSEPGALAISREGDIWVADTGNDRVEEFSTAGKFLLQIDPAESAPGYLEEPEGIAVDRDGDIWVSDTAEGKLVEFNAQGQYLRTVGSEGSGAGQLGEPEGITIDSRGHVWVADWSNNRVAEWNEQGEYLQEFGVAGSAPGQLEEPYAIAVNAGGDVWVGDVGNNSVEEYGEHGEFIRQFGAAGSAPGEFDLDFPMGLSVAPGGTIWVTDAENDRLERFNEQGEYLGGDCRAIAGASATSYTATAADVGFMLQALVTATNAEGTATVGSSPSAVVAPSPPVNTHPPTVEGIAEEGQTLTASNGSWSGVSLSYSYQWQSCNSAGEACTNIEGADGASYVVAAGEAGGTLRVLVSAENNAGKASAASAPSPVVGIGPPLNTRPPVIEGAAKVGLTLSANTGSWLGTGPLSYSYQWQSCDALGEGCIAIAGANSSTLLLSPEDLDTTLELTVTATNVAGEVSASSVPSAVVRSDLPENTAPPSVSGVDQEGQTLTASPGAWTGAQPITFSFQWQRCGTGLIGSAGSGNGQLKRPGDVAVNAGGDVWVADTGNDRVQEFNEHGEYLGQFGSPGSAPGELSEPAALALTPEGDVWVADTGNDRLEEFSPAGQFLMQIDPLEVEPDFLEEPEGIAVDRGGDIWVSDTGRGELVEFSEQGEYIRTVGSEGSGAGQLGEPEGITVDSRGHLWVADWSNHRVAEWNEQGEYLQQFGAAGSGPGQLEKPYGIAVGVSGDVWVGDVGDNRVKEYGEHGEFIRQFGGARGSAPGELDLWFPMGLAEADGTIWVSDVENDRVERFNEAGEYIAGGCTAIAGATGSSYTATTADVGSTLQVIVSAANAEGEAAATSPATNVIEAGAGS